MLCALLCSPAQAQERVLLLAPQTPEPMLLELYHRLEAELRIHGFETVTLVGTPDEGAEAALGAEASARGALAAIAVVLRNRNAALDVWLVDPELGRASLRSLSANAGDETANLVAVRAVDLLRASLAGRAQRTAANPARSGSAADSGGVSAPAAAAPGPERAGPTPEERVPEQRAGDAATPAQETDPADEPAAPRPPRRVALFSARAELFALWQGSRLPPGLGPALSVWLCPLRRLCLGAAAAGGFGLGRLETALGTATVRQQLFGVELELSLLELGALQLSAAGAGGVMLLQAEGDPKPPLVARDASQWSWTLAAGPRLLLELSAQWSVSASIRARVYLPDVVVAVDTQAARLSRPSLEAALGLAFAP